MSVLYKVIRNMLGKLYIYITCTLCLKNFRFYKNASKRKKCIFCLILIADKYWTQEGWRLIKLSLFAINLLFFP